MGFFTSDDYKDLHSLYTGQLRYLLSTENQIVDGLEAMITHADDTQLKQAFQSHQQETRVQAQRLEELLQELQGNKDDKKDPIVTALIGSAVNIVSETKSGAVRDAGLIATAQKIEHYEIASYGAAKAWAEALGLSRHVAYLDKSLGEEKHANELLNTISTRENAVAASA